MVTGALRASPSNWAAATASWALIAYLFQRPGLCSEDAACQASHSASFPSYMGYLAWGLLLVLLHEVTSLVSTYRGVQDTKALVPTMSNRCLPSLLHIFMFTILIAEYTILAVQPNAWFAHATQTIPGVASRPVYTIVYVEWVLIVPMLLLLAGVCALERPLEEMTRPVLLTNAYIMFAWAAMLTSSEVLRWTLVAAVFISFYIVSKDMVSWVEAYYEAVPADFPSRNLRPVLALGLIVDFSIYGVVYLLGITGKIPPSAELYYLTCLNVGTKLAFSIVFVAIRGEEYHRTLTRVLRNVSTSNVGMISLLRGSFDVLLPCSLDAKGTCELPKRDVADVLRMQGMLCRPVMGQSINELLADETEREHFATYVRNILSQAEAPQAFNKATLSVHGKWVSGHMPPVAQVLNCRLASGGAGEDGWVQACIHLSVVPHSGFASAERQVVVAIRFETEEGPDGSAEAPCFEEFDVNKEPEVKYTAEQDINASSGLGAAAIVASLLDLNRLGMSGILMSDPGSAADEASDEASSFKHPLSVASGDTLSHMGAYLKPPVDEKAMSKMVGPWHGTVSKALGAYAQTLTFSPGLERVTVEIGGKTMSGDCRVNWERSPAHLDIQLRQLDGKMAPTIPYIFQVTGDTMQLCGPSGTDARRPKAFDGPGLCFMHKLKENDVLELSDSGHSYSRQTTAEPEHPDYAYSRQASEEPEQEVTEARSVGGRSVSPMRSVCSTRRTGSKSSAAGLSAARIDEDRRWVDEAAAESREPAVPAKANLLQDFGLPSKVEVPLGQLGLVAATAVGTAALLRVLQQRG